MNFDELPEFRKDLKVLIPACGWFMPGSLSGKKIVFIELSFKGDKETEDR